MAAQTTESTAALEKRLAEATKHRDYYNGLSRETRDMAAERETPQGRDATMQAAIRYKSQALVWDREVGSLRAQIAGLNTPEVAPSPDEALARVRRFTRACADQDETMNFRGVPA